MRKRFSPARSPSLESQECLFVLTKPSGISAYCHYLTIILPIGDEFRERIVFGGSDEKFGKGVAQRVCNDKLRWRDAENAPLSSYRRTTGTGSGSGPAGCAAYDL